MNFYQISACFYFYVLMLLVLVVVLMMMMLEMAVVMLLQMFFLLLLFWKTKTNYGCFYAFPDFSNCGDVVVVVFVAGRKKRN